MGPYCQFCDRRCFVERILPATLPGTVENAVQGRIVMATCPEGMKHDRDATGYDYTTAINPTERSDDDQR